MDAIYAAVSLVIGGLASFLIDLIWFQRIKHAREVEAKNYFLKVHEHYHVGLELIIISVLAAPVIHVFTFAILGAGFGFLMAEWRQVHEIRHNRVVVGHPFAHGSGHFRASTALGAALVILLTLILLIRPS